MQERGYPHTGRYTCRILLQQLDTEKYGTVGDIAELRRREPRRGCGKDPDRQDRGQDGEEQN